MKIRVDVGQFFNFSQVKENLNYYSTTLPHFLSQPLSLYLSLCLYSHCLCFERNSTLKETRKSSFPGRSILLLATYQNILHLNEKSLLAVDSFSQSGKLYTKSYTLTRCKKRLTTDAHQNAKHHRRVNLRN